MTKNKLTTIQTLSSNLGYTIDTYSQFDIEGVLGDHDEYLEEGETPLDWDRFDHSTYVRNLANECAKILEFNFTAQRDKVVKNVICSGSRSPKEYNFSTDSAELDVIVDLEALRAYCLANLDSLDKYVKEHFTSYDGFTSFVTNNTLELLDLVNGDQEHTDWHRNAGAVLGWYMQTQFTTDHYLDSMYDRVGELGLESFSE